MTETVLVGDLGGTKLRLGLSDRLGTFLGLNVDTTTQKGAVALVEQIVATTHSLLLEAGIDPGSVGALGMGVPAVCNRITGRLERADNLRGLNGFPLAEALVTALGIPVLLENDVNAAAVGEYWLGAAAGIDNFVFIALGSGAGMGIFVGGKLLTGASGAAGEIAYLPIGADPYEPLLRERGAFTSVASGTGLASSARHLHQQCVGTSLRPDASAAELFAGAEKGDPLGLAILNQAASLTAQAILAVAAVLDPELVVLGGGVGGNPLLAPLLQDNLARLYPYPLAIKASELGDLAGLYGMLALTFESVSGSLPDPPEKRSVGRSSESISSNQPFDNMRSKGRDASQ